MSRQMSTVMLILLILLLLLLTLGGSDQSLTESTNRPDPEGLSLAPL